MPMQPRCTWRFVLLSSSSSSSSRNCSTAWLAAAARLSRLDLHGRRELVWEDNVVVQARKRGWQAAFVWTADVKPMRVCVLRHFRLPHLKALGCHPSLLPTELK